MVRILGIDPGSRITGFGIIESNGTKHTYITSGTIHTIEKDFPSRLKQIFSNITEIIKTYSPMLSAVEDIFMHINVMSALKLGQARGAAIAALAVSQIPVAQYPARQVKQSIVSYGAATKEQVKTMIKELLSIQGKMQTDASDALAIALCHVHFLGKSIKEYENKEH